MEKFEVGERVWVILPPPVDGVAAEQAKIYRATVQQLLPDQRFLIKVDGQGAQVTAGWHMGSDRVVLATTVQRTLEAMAQLYKEGARHIKGLVAKERIERDAKKQGKVMIQKEVNDG